MAGILSAEIEREAFHLGVTKVLAVNDLVARTIAGDHTTASRTDFRSLRPSDLTRH